MSTGVRSVLSAAPRSVAPSSPLTSWQSIVLILRLSNRARSQILSIPCRVRRQEQISKLRAQTHKLKNNQLLSDEQEEMNRNGWPSPEVHIYFMSSCQRYQLHRRDPNDMVNLARNPTQTLVSLSGVNIFCSQGGNTAIHRTVAQIS